MCVSVSRHTECRGTTSVTLPSDLHIALVSALSYCLLQNLMAFLPFPPTPEEVGAVEHVCFRLALTV